MLLHRLLRLSIFCKELLIIFCNFLLVFDTVKHLRQARRAEQQFKNTFPAVFIHILNPPLHRLVLLRFRFLRRQKIHLCLLEFFLPCHNIRVKPFNLVIQLHNLQIKLRDIIKQIRLFLLILPYLRRDRLLLALQLLLAPVCLVKLFRITFFKLHRLSRSTSHKKPVCEWRGIYPHTRGMGSRPGQKYAPKQ